MDTSKALLDIFVQYQADMTDIATRFRDGDGTIPVKSCDVSGYFGGFPPYTSQPRLRKFSVGLSIDFTNSNFEFGLNWVLLLGWSTDKWYVQGRVIASFMEDPYQTLWFATEPVEETEQAECIKSLELASQKMTAHARHFLENGDIQRAFDEAKAEPTFDNFF